MQLPDHSRCSMICQVIFKVFITLVALDFEKLDKEAS